MCVILSLGGAYSRRAIKPHFIGFYRIFTSFLNTTSFPAPETKTLRDTEWLSSDPWPMCIHAGTGGRLLCCHKFEESFVGLRYVFAHGTGAMSLFTGRSRCVLV